MIQVLSVPAPCLDYCLPCSIIYIVKPVLRGHLWDKEKVTLQDK